MALTIKSEGMHLPKPVEKSMQINGVNNIYIKIDSNVSTKTTIVLEVSFYNKIELEGIEPELQKLNIGSLRYEFPIDLEGGNNLLQGYNYLKTLPEFLDCEDC